MTERERELVARLCAARAGLAVDPAKGYLLESRLAPVARREGFASVVDLIRAVRDREEERLIWAVVEAMAPADAVFFRDPALFQALKDDILPHAARMRGGEPDPLGGPLRLDAYPVAAEFLNGNGGIGESQVFQWLRPEGSAGQDLFPLAELRAEDTLALAGNDDISQFRCLVGREDRLALLFVKQGAIQRPALQVQGSLNRDSAAVHRPGLRAASGGRGQAKSQGSHLPLERVVRWLGTLPVIRDRPAGDGPAIIELPDQRPGHILAARSLPAPAPAAHRRGQRLRLNQLRRVNIRVQALWNPHIIGQVGGEAPRTSRRFIVVIQCPALRVLFCRGSKRGDG